MTELETLRAKLAEVKKRLVYDFYAGSSPNSQHWWCCGACGSTWRDGHTEHHAPSCPLEERNDAEAKKGDLTVYGLAESQKKIDVV